MQEKEKKEGKKKERKREKRKKKRKKIKREAPVKKDNLKSKGIRIPAVAKD